MPAKPAGVFRAAGKAQSSWSRRTKLRSRAAGSGTVPDVSSDASWNNSGVTCYESGGLSYDCGGTSLACPCWAGLIAIANQGLVAEGGTTLNSPANPQQALQVLYRLPASDFHDITTGYNGYSAGPGYDEVTGIGTPIANLLIPDLVSIPLRLYQSSMSISAGHFSRQHGDRHSDRQGHQLAARKYPAAWTWFSAWRWQYWQRT